jgi:hypothetical protein
MTQSMMDLMENVSDYIDPAARRPVECRHEDTVWSERHGERCASCSKLVERRAA